MKPTWLEPVRFSPETISYLRDSPDYVKADLETVAKLNMKIRRFLTDGD